MGGRIFPVVINCQQQHALESKAQKEPHEGGQRGGRNFFFRGKLYNNLAAEK